MFKAGDLVKCVESSGTSLQHGYVYRVEVVSDDGRFVRFWDYELDAAVAAGYHRDLLSQSQPLKEINNATAS